MYTDPDLVRLAVVEEAEQQAGREDEQDARQHADAGAVDAPGPLGEHHVADSIGVHLVLGPGGGGQLQEAGSTGGQGGKLGHGVSSRGTEDRCIVSDRRWAVSRGGRRYKTFETATADSATLVGWNGFRY